MCSGRSFPMVLFIAAVFAVAACGGKLSDDEKATALGYLERPLHPSETDPTKLAPEHRLAVLELARQMVQTDGVVTDEEADCLETLELVLG